MEISRLQLATIAPDASAQTLNALFALDADGQPHIVRAMREAGITEADNVAQFAGITEADNVAQFAGITEPDDVAQFLAVASLASNGFVNFATMTSGHILAQSPVDWLRDKVKDWYDLKMSDESRTWDWSCIVNHLGVRWAINGADWLDTWDALNRVCDVLGVENRSEEFALQG